MNEEVSRKQESGRPLKVYIALLCIMLLAPGDSLLLGMQAQQPAAGSQEAPPKIPPEQLDSLVAPIALYPDPMLSQTLVAATYPLEIIQLQQWLEKNKGLKDKALADAVKKQDWDPSIQAMAALPDVVKQLAENVKWTTDLGNAFLAQQSDVMDAVQRMRKKAMDSGNLKSSEQQKVETKVVESKTVVVVEQANPQVVYVPSYNPTVVYGPPPYPYPPIAYPPPGYYAAGMAISFGVGVAMGAMWGGGWGWGCGWGGNDIDINVDNNFNRNTNVNRNSNVDRSRTNVRGGSGSGGSKWQHNPQHRGGAPYSDRATANKFGGTARGDSLSSRQNAARQGQARSGGRAQAGSMDRGSGGRSQAGSMDRGTGGRSGSGAGASARSSDMSRSGGGDRVGSRETSGSRGGGGRDSFGGASSGMSGGSARASSQRGSSSMGSRGGGGGGFSRGGGGGRRR